MLLLLFDSLVVLCFKQTSIVTKTVMMRRRITMATATTTPMMTAVSTLPEPGVSGVSEGGGGGGGVGESYNLIDCYKYCL